MNVASFLLAAARESPERVAFRRSLSDVDHTTPSSLSYGALDRASARLAGQLQQLGVAPGSRVVVQTQKNLSGIVLYLAVVRSGAIYVPLNAAYTGREVSYFVSDSEPVLVVADPSTYGNLEPVTRAANVRLAVLGSMPSDPSEAFRQLDPWTGDDASAPEVGVHETGPSDLAAILYTSGTTGRSKGAMLTHGNLVSNAETLCDIWQITANDVLVHVLPVFHVHGLFVAINTVLSRGACVLFMEQFDAQATLAAFREASVFMGVPTHYTRLLECDELTAETCSSMRLFTSGSAPLDPVTFEAFAQRSGHAILERYGMTEAGMITSNPYAAGGGSNAVGFPHGERIAGTVGFALPDVSVEVRDDAGNPAAPDVVGRLRVRGPNVFAGYWRQPEKTAEAISEDGWLESGDLASADQEGRITLVGRSTDMIIVGGYNVYPREIEDCLLEIEGVQQAAVVGVPHPVMGEGVVACLVAMPDGERPNDEVVRRALHDGLADFKRPRVIEWLDALPRNAMGKVQKTVLKQQYKTAYGETDA